MNEPVVPCPETLRLAFEEMLRDSLLAIRSHSSNRELVLALADHVHNIPSLLSRFSPELLRYYWEVEMPNFLRDLPADSVPVAMFRPHWAVIEQEYRRICFPETKSNDGG